MINIFRYYMRMGLAITWIKFKECFGFCGSCLDMKSALLFLLTHTIIKRAMQENYEEWYTSILVYFFYPFFPKLYFLSYS